MKQKLLSIVAKIFYSVPVLLSLFQNFYRFKKGKIPKFEYSLRKKFLSYVTQFGTTDFYQNYPPLFISGKRSTLCRFNKYKLDEILNNHMQVLDIGGNIGFFSAYISKFADHVDLIEKNKKLTEICYDLIKHENIQNLNIQNTDFLSFKTDKKYDLIFSLAVHGWLELGFTDYINKVLYLLNHQGFLILESHFIYKNQQDQLIRDKVKSISNISIVHSGLIDDNDGKIREFFILRKV